MSTVGLTKARERALRDFYHAPTGMLITLHDLGLIESPTPHTGLTPRGHAALAAPRMTRAEYDMLCYAEASPDDRLIVGPLRAVAERLEEAGMLCVEQSTFCRLCKPRLTPAGRTALNNVRAAMPGPWEPMT